MNTPEFDAGVEARQNGRPRVTPTSILRRGDAALSKAFVAGWDAADRMIKTNREAAKVANPKAPRSAR